MTQEPLGAMMNCDIIIPVYNQLHYTRECLKSIAENTHCPHRILIVDDASGQETAQYLDTIADGRQTIVLHNAKNLGWVGSVNHGIDASSAEYVCIMNNDTVVYPGWLEEMVAVAGKDRTIGLVNPEWELPKRFAGSRQEYFRSRILPRKGTYIETDWARGFCFLVTRAVIAKIKGLDEAFAPGYYDDWDFSLRAIGAGFSAVKACGAFVWHYRNVTYGLTYSGKAMDAALRQKAEVFHRRWGVSLEILCIEEQRSRDGLTGREGFIRRLLRGQNRIVFISGSPDAPVRHTNFSKKRPLFGSVRLCALFVLLDNMRHNRLKRFDRIICSPSTAGFLKKFARIRHTFTFLELSGSPDGYDAIEKDIDSEKQRKFLTRFAKADT